MTSTPVQVPLVLCLDGEPIDASLTSHLNEARLLLHLAAMLSRLSFARREGADLVPIDIREVAVDDAFAAHAYSGQPMSDVKRALSALAGLAVDRKRRAELAALEQ
jgi:hypothetical protein